MPIIKPMTYNCNRCGWNAVKMEGDLKHTRPGHITCPTCGDELDEKLGSVFDLLNPIKRVRGLRLDMPEIRKQ